MVILISLAALVSTLLGGFFALKFKDKLHLVLGFSAGAVLGVAFFDLLPEAIELSAGVLGVTFITSVIALGFSVYMLLDRLAVLHTHAEDESGHRHRGQIGAASLSLHSFLDGLAIGLAFKVSSSVGAVVAVAVLAHDFSDGINTVNLILKGKGHLNQALKWLIIDALAPLAGVLSTLFFVLDEKSLGLILALFCGFFIYIGASELLPESHHAHPTKWTTFTTLAGLTAMYAVIRLANL